MSKPRPHGRRLAGSLILLIVVWALAPMATQAAYLQDDSTTSIDFNQQIRPLLATHCFACHGPDEGDRQAGLRLDTFSGATEAAIVPGDPEGSEVLWRLTSDDPDLAMPPPAAGKSRLDDAEIELLRQWIASGANYDQHWSLVPLRRPDPPQETAWLPQQESPHPVDRFVRRTLTQRGLDPMPRQQRTRLARRVALDLTGLPPDPEQLERFLQDSRPDAYPRYVRRLLADPAYGEHWASYWLDLARYADTDGYADDLPRTIWPYRDWVIQAYNQDLPFDQFTIEQLAGDLLPNPTLDQRIATGFHRNTLTNSEGGTIDEEFRTEAVTDRVDTTLQVWTGFTMGCAKCHSHKYDPITHEEYYQLYAIFNQTADSDLPGNPPTLRTYSLAVRDSAEQLEQQIAALERDRGQDSPEFHQRLLQWLAGWPQDQAAWRVLPLQEAKSQQGAELRVLAADGHDHTDVSDHWRIVAGGASPQRDTYLVRGRWSADHQAPLTAVRLNVQPRSDAAPDTAGPVVGRSPGNGNFVLSEVQLQARPVASAAPRGRYVRLELPGNQRILHIAELQVLAEVDGQQQLVSPRGQVRQSSTDFGGLAERAIDGNPDGDYQQGSVTHTATESNPWLELELDQDYSVQEIVIHNRTDNGLHRRLDGVQVQILDDQRQAVWEHSIQEATIQPMVLPTDGWQAVRFAWATADYHQDRGPEAWHAGRTIDGDLGSKGWAVGPQRDRPHHLILQLASPLPAHTDWDLEFQFVQNYGSHHTLANLQLETTSRPTSQVAVPTEVADLWLQIAAGGPPPAEPGSQPPTAPSGQELWEALNEEQQATVRQPFAATDPLGGEIRQQLADLRKQLESLPTAETPVMVELPESKRRTSRLLIKGSWLNPGDEVQTGLPEAMTQSMDMAAYQEQLDGGRWDRLALARWLVDPQHPMVARVAVNRLWARLFGRGLVETEEDFGVMGSPPTHPELLDWLASYFKDEAAWSQKDLLFLLVTSQTYCQTNQVDPARYQADPENRWLSRGPRYRLSAEQIRDQALAVSGLLNRTMYGPGIVPRMTIKELGSAFSGRTITESQGDDLYRRGVYIYVRRTGPYPTILTFDGTNRQVCTVRRITTNTPLQALVTLNDPVYVEAAQGLARLAMTAPLEEMVSLPLDDSASTADPNADGIDDATGQRIAWAFRRATSRLPTPEELAVLSELWQAERDSFEADPEAARQLATEPLGPLPEDLDPVTAAAWTVLGNVLLNLDEVMTN